MADGEDDVLLGGFARSKLYTINSLLIFLRVIQRLRWLAYNGIPIPVCEKINNPIMLLSINRKKGLCFWLSSKEIVVRSWWDIIWYNWSWTGKLLSKRVSLKHWLMCWIGTKVCLTKDWIPSKGSRQKSSCVEALSLYLAKLDLCLMPYETKLSKN